MKREDLPLPLERDELRGLSRTVAEIEWLLLVLVLLYQAFGKPDEYESAAISMAMMFFAAFVLAFRYTNFYKNESRWKIATETWVMMIFITWSLWFTGKTESPLLNTYLLVIITSALTLGKLSTAAEIVVIGIALALLGNDSSSTWLSLAKAGSLAVEFAPFVLVGYITTMFSADIRYGLSKVRALAETDELTGLLNRRAFSVITERIFGQAARYGRPLSILTIDSDGLKQVNDNHGHSAGDDLLQLLAQCIQRELRTTDILARFGGDEFVAALPETPAAAARDVAERVRHAVENSHTNVHGEMVKTTVSIGIATYPDDGRILETVLANADSALYRAKSAGRNQVVEFSGRESAATT